MKIWSASFFLANLEEDNDSIFIAGQGEAVV